MDPIKAPLFEKVLSHYERNTSSFHVPGHKSGAGTDADPSSNFFQPILSIDYTEITGLDDLHQPQGAIKEAEQLAAACFGAEQTFFLVNGSTVGNLAMILTLCKQGDIVIVQRNIHKSVIHAMMLAGARAVFLSPRWDEDTGAAAGIRLDELESALHQYPDAKGVFLTNPNYYGMGIEMKAVTELVHSFDKPVLVDEAHGAHYGFHPEVPASSLSCGADAAVQSTHKMLTAMTMGAMLHVQGKRIDRELLRQRLGMLQSSSPSYPIMVSLDLCRRRMHVQGKESLSAGLQAVHHFHRCMQDVPWFQLVKADLKPSSTAYETKDPFKVIVRDTTGTLTGYALQRELERHGCMVEMADRINVLLVFSLASTLADASRLASAFRHISEELRLGKKEIEGNITNIQFIPRIQQLSPPIDFSLNRSSHSLTGNKELFRTVSLQEAVNERIAEMVIPYPPGIPILYPGEMMNTQTAQYLRKLAELGAKFQGVSDPELKSINIYVDR